MDMKKIRRESFYYPKNIFNWIEMEEWVMCAGGKNCYQIQWIFLLEAMVFKGTKNQSRKVDIASFLGTQLDY